MDEARHALRLEAVEGARLLKGNDDDQLPEGEEDDALDGPELGDGAEGQQPLGGDDVHEHEGVPDVMLQKFTVRRGSPRT